MKRLALFSLFLLGFCSFAGTIDTSENIFFPKKFGEDLTLIKSFPTTRWNFLILDGNHYTGEQISQSCQSFVQNPLLERMECGLGLKTLFPIAKAWAQDIAIRENAPSKVGLEKTFNQTLAKASLPLPNELLAFLRWDPLGTQNTLMEHALRRQPLQLERKEGVFYDPEAKLFVVPFRPTFLPSESDQTQTLLNEFGSAFTEKSWWAIGAHFSGLENRKQIDIDLENMSLVGAFFILLYMGIVLYLKKLRLLWGIPMTFVGNAIGTIATILIFGSIHGIVLAFGIGIMGLLLDYTLHGAFKSKSTHVWYSNLMGLFTTLAAFGILAFSQVPLFRQLAAFSIIGLTVSFGIIFIVHRFFGDYLEVEPLPITLYDSKWMRRLVLFLAFGWGLSVWTFQPKFDMRQFDFQSPKTTELYRWLGKNLKISKPLFEVLSGDDENTLKAAHERLEWGKNQAIMQENIGFYLPTIETQQIHLATWKKLSCPNLKFNTKEEKFFAPFLNQIRCENLKPVLLESKPLYIQDLIAGTHALNIWLPKDESETVKIKAAYPNSYSLLELVNEFPKTLTKELLWMIPICFTLILSLLWLYYRKLTPAVIALVPTFIGMGALAWAIFFGMPFSFVSLVGVIMLLGLGVDYGIFAVDHARLHASEQEAKEEHGNNSALVFAAGTTLAGYIPLLFCQHQVLVHLGQVLTIGTLGSVLGALWGVPALKKWIAK